MKTFIAFCAALVCTAALANEPVVMSNQDEMIVTPVQSVSNCRNGRCRVRSHSTQVQSSDSGRGCANGRCGIRRGGRTVIRSTR